MRTKFFTILAAILLTACAETDNSGNSKAITIACSQSPAGKVTIVDSWVRPAPEGRPISAAYLTICNRSDAAVVLTGAEAAVAEAVELHETTRDRDGVASMAPVDRIEIGPGDSVSLAPGGVHIMLIGVNQQIVPGDGVDLTLRLEGSPPIMLNATARESNMATDAHKGH